MSDTIIGHIDRAIQDSQQPVIVEIGAARGEDTIRIIDRISALKPGCSYEYYAFEPDPRNIAEIKTSKANPFIHLMPMAVGDANKRTTFHQSGGTNPQFGYEHTLSGSLKQPVQHLQAHPWCKFEKEINVRMVTLDSFYEFASLSHIDFIWCDVQGAEDLVLEGGAFALSNTRYFYTEYYQSEMYRGQIPAEEIHRRLGNNWRIIQRWPYDILFENDRTERRGTATLENKKPL